MKKFVSFLIVFLLSLPSAEAFAAGKPLRVLTSFLPMYLFTKNTVGSAPGVSVDMMLPASLGCPHDYALVPSDMKKIAAADLFIVNGKGMEEFLGAPVRKANPKVVMVDTSAGVTPLRNKDGEEHGEFNPHTWVSPRNAVLQVRAIEQALSKATPENREIFRRNADAYVKRLERLIAEFDQAAKRFRNRNIVTFHNVFDYLARDAGLTIVGEIEAVPGQEPSAGEIHKLIETIKAKKAAAVFGEPQYPARLAEMVAREAGVPVRGLDPVATGSTSLTTYEDVMRDNLRVLQEVLGK
jgi:ABC-type Zn uptake system ZnuABC Zn-binding protein ZnuA